MSGVRRTASAYAAVLAMTAALALLLFGGAGTFVYAAAWVYLAIFGAGTFAITRYLAINDPALLERRMRGGATAEDTTTQKFVQSIASAAFLVLLLVPALDRRFGWSQLPIAAHVVGDALSVACFGCVFFVFRENTFASATVRVFESQTVITSGPYAVVRHPMYSGAALLFAGTPLALGSYYGLAATPVLLAVLVWRLVHEERLLTAALPEYAAYRRRVRWRLIPGVL